MMKFRLLLVVLLAVFFYSLAHSQPISKQAWQTSTISSDSVAIDCAQEFLPYDLGRLLIDSDPINTRGEMDKTLRSGKPVKLELQPESGTSDNLSSITGCSINGASVLLATQDVGDTIVVQHSVASIEFPDGVDVVLDDPRQVLGLIRKAGVWVPESTSSSSATVSLQAAYNAGKTISGLDSQANAVVFTNDGTTGFRFYLKSGAFSIECFNGGSACDIVNDIPSSQSYILKYNGTTGLTIDSSGNVTLTNALIETKSFYFGSGSLSTDGTQCTDPAEITINSGPKTWGINCADNAGSIVYGSVGMPDGYNGGTVTFELQAENENATPSGVLDFDFSAMCRGDGDTINSTWGTAANASITFANQYVLEHATTAAVTPNGTCAAGDTLFWRAVMDSVSTTTQVANTYILGVKMEYPTNDWSDN